MHPEQPPTSQPPPAYPSYLPPGWQVPPAAVPQMLGAHGPMPSYLSQAMAMGISPALVMIAALVFVYNVTERHAILLTDLAQMTTELQGSVARLEDTVNSRMMRYETAIERLNIRVDAIERQGAQP